MRASFGNCATAPRTVYLTFDADGNGSGQQAAQCLSRSLRERGITARLVSLPEGHDPNSFFVRAAMRISFTACWSGLACEISCRSTA